MVEGETAEFLEFLQGAATRMELLVRDLLAYTQVTKLDEKPEATDANQTLAEALVNLGGAITESGAAVTSDKLPVLRAHGTHLRQLFQNLIGNAIKYRSDDRTPTVHIGAERQDGNWVFTVSDNGIGISPEFKEQIFGLFTRLHNGFDVDKMIRELEDAVQQALNDGYLGLWATGDMTWEFGSRKETAKLLEYEGKLEDLFRRQPALCGICQYHVDTLPPESVRQGLLTHPSLFINETLSRVNPHYVPRERLTADMPLPDFHLVEDL